MIENTKKIWVKPSLTCIANDYVQTGGTGAYFETAYACDGPLAANPSNTPNPGPGNDPDCGTVTGFAVLGGGTVYMGLTGTMTIAFSGNCFGACS